jgi:hypothetical protein
MRSTREEDAKRRSNVKRRQKPRQRGYRGTNDSKKIGPTQDQQMATGDNLNRKLPPGRGPVGRGRAQDHLSEHHQTTSHTDLENGIAKMKLSIHSLEQREISRFLRSIQCRMIPEEFLRKRVRRCAWNR